MVRYRRNRIAASVARMGEATSGSLPLRALNPHIAALMRATAQNRASDDREIRRTASVARMSEAKSGVSCRNGQISTQSHRSKRSPDERSDIRVFASPGAQPAYRCAHAGYGSKPRKRRSRNSSNSKRSPDGRSEIRGIMPEWSDTDAIASPAENSFSRWRWPICDQPLLSIQRLRAACRLHSL